MIKTFIKTFTGLFMLALGVGTLGSLAFWLLVIAWKTFEFAGLYLASAFILCITVTAYEAFRAGDRQDGPNWQAQDVR